MNEYQYKTKKAGLVIALFIPFLFILFIILSVYISNSKEVLDQDFIYAVYDTNGSLMFSDHIKYSVKDGKLVETIEKNRDSYNNRVDPITGKELEMNPIEPKLYIYKHETDESVLVEKEDLSDLDFSDQISSENGITIESTYTSNRQIFPFFDSRGERIIYAKKNKDREILNNDILDNSDDRYYYYNEDQFSFLAWIKNK